MLAHVIRWLRARYRRRARGRGDIKALSAHLRRDIGIEEARPAEVSKP